MITQTDKKWMRKAIRLSRGWIGKTHPNPSVGCVMAKDETLFATGVHRGPGTPHAEIEAIQSCSREQLDQATCYVTLEPCNHHGLTPPCTDAIIASGIKRVIIALPDLNPEVAGGGSERLRAAGLDVHMGVQAETALEVLEPWLVWKTTGKPYVTLKMAMSLDGRIATVTGQSKWISNEKSRRMVHDLRKKTMGIMVGAGTVIHDDPQLTARKGGRVVYAPVRVIIDRKAKAPLNAQIFSSHMPGKTLWMVGESSFAKSCSPPSDAYSIIPCPELKTGLDLEYVMRYLGREASLESVLLEGGPTLAFSMIEQNLVHKVMIFISPRLIGGASAPAVLGGKGFKSLKDTPKLSYVSTRKVAEDMLIVGYLGDRPCLQELSEK